MDVYVIETRERQARTLAATLKNSGLKPSFVSTRELESGMYFLMQGGAENRAILLGGDQALPIISKMRGIGAKNSLIVVQDTADPVAAALLLNAGADDVVGMPVNMDEIQARIQAITRRQYGHTSPGIVIGEIEGYLDGRNPLVSGHELALSRREAEVFQHLLLRRGTAVSRQRIYESLYGLCENKPFERIIDTYILKLRKKISAAAASGARYIETQRTRGYIIVDPTAAEARLPGKASSAA